jgi:hypothetical protein
MSAFASASRNGQSFLDLLAAAARRAADYSRFQGMSRRYLDDAGVTPGELDAALAQAGVLGRCELTRALAHSV